MLRFPWWKIIIIIVPCLWGAYSVTPHFFYSKVEKYNDVQAQMLLDQPVDDQALLAKFPEISNILSQLVKHPKVANMPIDIDFNSADSVAYHLAGLIPIPWTHKQSLLEAFDASQRFLILSKYIEEISTS